MVEPLGYGVGLVGMMPLDVVKDTGTLVSGGFGLKHKWEKRKAEERARMHQMASTGWGASGGELPGAVGLEMTPSAGGSALPEPGATPKATASGPGRKLFGRAKRQEQEEAERQEE